VSYLWTARKIGGPGELPGNSQPEGRDLGASGHKKDKEEDRVSSFAGLTKGEKLRTEIPALPENQTKSRVQLGRKTSFQKTYLGCRRKKRA